VSFAHSTTKREARKGNENAGETHVGEHFSTMTRTNSSAAPMTAGRAEPGNRPTTTRQSRSTGTRTRTQWWCACSSQTARPASYALRYRARRSTIDGRRSAIARASDDGRRGATRRSRCRWERRGVGIIISSPTSRKRDSSLRDFSGRTRRTGEERGDALSRAKHSRCYRNYAEPIGGRGSAHAERPGPGDGHCFRARHSRSHSSAGLATTSLQRRYSVLLSRRLPRLARTKAGLSYREP